MATLRIKLWTAINEYAESCGGDTGADDNSNRRMDAVVAVEKAVDAEVQRLKDDLQLLVKVINAPSPTIDELEAQMSRYKQELEELKAQIQGTPEPTLLVIEANVRYWEDATVNSVEDADGSLIPFRKGDLWTPVIELATGRILDWPQNVVAKIYYKVCDAGEYWLAANDGTLLSKLRDCYVPSFLSVGDNGYGDYIIMRVDSDGRIRDWEPPVIYDDAWEEC